MIYEVVPFIWWPRPLNEENQSRHFAVVSQPTKWRIGEPSKLEHLGSHVAGLVSPHGIVLYWHEHGFHETCRRLARRPVGASAR